MKRDFLKKVRAVAFAFVAVLMAVPSTTCLAYDDGAIESAISYNGSFSKAWQLVYNDPAHDTVITYGFNTTLINEDYCYAVQTAKMHWAEIENAKDWYYGPTKAAGKSSNLEVPHAGTRVEYYCAWM